MPRHYDRVVSKAIDSEGKASWRSWLVELSSGDEGVTGFDAAGWEASTWVLNFMYEAPDRDGGLTHDDVHRDAVRRGIAAPLIVGSVNLDEVSTVVGNSLGMSTPDPGWFRLRWRALAERLSISLNENEFPPCFKWFPYKSWSANLMPPDEGSLDTACLHALVEQLVLFSPQGRATRCVAYYSPLAIGGNFDDTWMEEVNLGEVVSLVDPARGRIGTPSNLWPIDRSWMMFTDWDLWGTKVSGPRKLVDALDSAPDLECIAWHRPGDGQP